MDQVRQELDRLIVRRGVGYAAVSRLLGRNSSYIQQFIKRGSPRRLEREDISRLARYFGVAEEALGAPSSEADGLVPIPVLDLDASAGFGAIARSEAGFTRFGFDERWLRNLTAAEPGSLSIIHVAGDSMEPTLRSGDQVLVDTSLGGRKLRDGIYVIRSDDTIMVKRIALSPGSRQITICSDNPTYPAWTDIEPGGLHIVGRVIWFGRSV